jgi:hypothetical protein
MSQGTVPHAGDNVRVPRLRAVVALLLTLVATGLVVFLRRYRGADRTAVALALLSAAGLCLVVGLAWFQHRFGGRPTAAARVRQAGLWTGLLAGVSAAEVGAVLLALRWAIDQQGSPAAELLAPAFVRALTALGPAMLTGAPAYLAVGGAVGALAGLGVAEIVLGCAVPEGPAPAARDGRRASGSASPS